MIGLYISLSALGLLLLSFLVGSYLAYKKIFYAYDEKKRRDPYSGIDKRGYKPYEGRMRSLIDNILSLPYEKIEITSRDGLKLSARYYHVRDGAPLEIQCHGYRSTPLRDFAASGVECYKRQYNLLLIDHRAHGESEGNVISFGINERFDLISWIEYALERFGKETEIVLYGISMGGATVLMAAGESLPENVKGVIADSPFSSALDIITLVSGKRGAPRFLIAPLAICGALIFGKFWLLSSSPRKAASKIKIPALIIHGDADSFVPDFMSDEIARENPEIELVKFPGADHAASFLSDEEKYLSLIDGFVDRILGGKNED